LTNITIAIDAMGGDYGTKVTVPAAVSILEKHHDLKLILVGDQTAIQKELNNTINDRLSIQHASEVVDMDELPSKALRSKKDSSLRVALNLVKENRARACVSAGNTGALVATAHYVLKTLPEVDRPAIIRSLPTLIKDKKVSMLDLGANVYVTPEQLYQFAVMGSVLVTEHFNIERPKVALLNIGVEQIKGNEQVREADKIFSQSRFLNYVGYIEGDGIFSGKVDIVVCDGFIGNIALKAVEGFAKLIACYTKSSFSRNLFAKISALIAMSSLKNLKDQINPGKFNGASLIGLKGIVIKSHGSANAADFANAIEEAILEVGKNIPEKIGEKVGMLLKEEIKT
jgi:phosphate acyltransferase